MPARWTINFVGKSRASQIRQKERASYMGLMPEYVCMALAGKREPRDAEQNFLDLLTDKVRKPIN